MSSHRLYGVVLASLILGGCGKVADARRTSAAPGSTAPAISAVQPVPTLFEIMEQVVVPASKVLWDVSNTKQDDNDNLTGSRVTATDWKQIEDAAAQLKAAAETLAGDAHIVIAPTGVAIQDQASPGSASPQQVQGFINADPAGFAERAKALLGSAETMRQAASTHNSSQLGDALGKLDGICEQGLARHDTAL